MNAEMIAARAARLAEPAPVPGLDAWTAPALPGEARLPWLPDAGRDVSAENILFAIAVIVLGGALLVGGAGWEQAAGAALLVVGAVLAWRDARERAQRRADSFVAILPQAGCVQVAHAAMELDASITLAGLRAVDVVPEQDGARLLLRHATAPAVMASGVLPRAAAEAAAEGLARRLGIAAGAAEGPPAATPAWAPVMAEAPAPRAEDRIPIGGDPVEAGRQATHVGIAMIAFGVLLLVFPGVPALMRWGLGLGLVAGGAAVIRLRARWQAAERGRYAVVDRPGGTIALHGLRGTEVAHIPLAVVRRVMVVTGSETTGVGLDCLDRPRVMLPMLGTLQTAQALAEHLAEAIGCPVGRA